LEVQVARSDWFEQIVAQLGIGGYLITPLTLFQPEFAGQRGWCESVGWCSGW
jgi:hypothetical protein